MKTSIMSFTLSHSSRFSTESIWNTSNLNSNMLLLFDLNHRFFSNLLSFSYSISNKHLTLGSFCGKFYESTQEFSHAFLVQYNLNALNSKKLILKSLCKFFSSLTLLKLNKVFFLSARNIYLSRDFINWLSFQTFVHKCSLFCGFFPSISSRFLSAFISYQLSLKQKQKVPSFQKSLAYGIFSLVRSFLISNKQLYIGGISVGCFGRWKKTVDARTKRFYCSYGALQSQSVKNTLDFHSTISKTKHGICSIKTLVSYNIF